MRQHPWMPHRITTVKSRAPGSSQAVNITRTPASRIQFCIVFCTSARASEGIWWQVAEFATETESVTKMTCRGGATSRPERIRTQVPGWILCMVNVRILGVGFPLGGREIEIVVRQAVPFLGLYGVLSRVDSTGSIRYRVGRGFCMERPVSAGGETRPSARGCVGEFTLLRYHVRLQLDCVRYWRPCWWLIRGFPIRVRRSLYFNKPS
jgi:hypothetical protein